MALTPALEQQIEEEVSQKHFNEMTNATTFDAQKKVIQKALKVLDGYLNRYDSDTQVAIITKATNYLIFTTSQEVRREAMRELDQRREKLLLLEGAEPEAKARSVGAAGFFTNVMKSAVSYFGGKANNPEDSFLRRQAREYNRNPDSRDTRAIDESKMPKIGKKK